MNRKNIQCENISSTVSADEGNVEDNEQRNRENVARDSSTPDVDVDQVADDREHIERNSSSFSDMSFHEDGEDAIEHKERNSSSSSDMSFHEDGEDAIEHEERNSSSDMSFHEDSEDAIEHEERNSSSDMSFHEDGEDAIEHKERNSSSSSDMSFHEDGEDAIEHKGDCIFHPHGSDNLHCEEHVEDENIVNDDDEDDVFTESSNSPNSEFIAAAKKFDNLDYDPYDPDLLIKWFEEKKANESRNNGSDRVNNVYIDEDVNGEMVTKEIVKGEQVLNAIEQVNVYSNEDIEVQAVYENGNRNEFEEYGERDISSSRDSDIDVDIDVHENFDYDLIDPEQLINWQNSHENYDVEYRERSPLNFSDRKLYEEDDANYKDRQLSTTHDCENLNQDVTLDPDSINCDVKNNVNVENEEKKTLNCFNVFDEDTVEIVVPNGDMNDGANVGNDKNKMGPNENENRGAVWSPPDQPCDISIAMIFQCIKDDRELMEKNNAGHE